MHSAAAAVAAAAAAAAAQPVIALLSCRCSSSGCQACTAGNCFVMGSVVLHKALRSRLWVLPAARFGSMASPLNEWGLRLGGAWQLARVVSAECGQQPRSCVAAASFCCTAAVPNVPDGNVGPTADTCALRSLGRKQCAAEAAVPSAAAVHARGARLPSPLRQNIFVCSVPSWGWCRLRFASAAQAQASTRLAHQVHAVAGFVANQQSGTLHVVAKPYALVF